MKKGSFEMKQKCMSQGTNEEVLVSDTKRLGICREISLFPGSFSRQ